MEFLKKTAFSLGMCLATFVALASLPQITFADTYVFVNHLMKGSRGIEVQNLQNFLTSQGLYSGPITAYFGPLTQAAVERFQTKYGIEAIGEVGPKTRTQLNSLTGGSSSSPAIQNLEQQIVGLQKQLDALTASSAASASILQSLQNQIANIQNEINTLTGSQGIGATQSSTQLSAQNPQVQGIQSQINALQNIQNQLNSNPNPSLQDVQSQMNALQQIQNQTIQGSGAQSPSAQSLQALQNQINSNSNPSQQDVQNQMNALQQIMIQMSAPATQP